MFKLPPEDNVGFLIAVVRRAMKREFDAKFKRYGITPPQFDLLYRLWTEDGLLLSELARRTYKDNPTISGLIDRLEKKQLIKRKRDENDHRAIKVSLTKKGKGLEGTLIRLVKEIVDKALKGLIPFEVENLKRLLLKVWMNLELKEKE